MLPFLSPFSFRSRFRSNSPRAAKDPQQNGEITDYVLPFFFLFIDFVATFRLEIGEVKRARADNDILARRYPEIITSRRDARKAG